MKHRVVSEAQYIGVYLSSSLIVCLIFHLFNFYSFHRLFCNVVIFIVVSIAFQTFSVNTEN